MKWEKTLGGPAPDNLDLGWTGWLKREAHRAVGRLADSHGWALTLAGDFTGPTVLALEARLERHGVEMAPWADHGERLAFSEPGYDPVWVGSLYRYNAGSWQGTLTDPDGWVLHVRGTPTQPGQMTLAAEIRERPKAFRKDVPKAEG